MLAPWRKGAASWHPNPGGGNASRPRYDPAMRMRHRSDSLLVILALLVAGCERSDQRGDDGFAPDSVPDAFAHPSAALMWPGATRAFQITSAGDLYNGAWAVRIRLGAGPDTAAGPRTIAYENRWRPTARWTRLSGAVRWDFEALALPEPARDSGLLVSLVARAHNHGPGPQEARLALHLEPPPYLPVFLAWDAPETGRLRWGTGSGPDSVNGWCAGTARGTVLERAWTLDPGETRAERILLPAYPTPARELAAAARRPHARWKSESRRYWDHALARGAGFELGDPEVEHALNAARVVLLSCRERRGLRWVPIGGPFQYRDVWLRDGARFIHALAVAGHVEEARALARGFLDYQWSHGAFLSQRGQPDGTGQALWAFEQALLRGQPPDSLAEFAEAAQRAWRWFEWQREYGRLSGWRWGRMMPFADPRDGELVRAQLVGTDLWSLAGYRSAARLLRASGRGADADSVERSADRYRADLMAALDSSGSFDVPASWQGIGRDWGNLTAGWPCAALPADHPRLRALARRVWNTAGWPGLATYGHRDSLHGYLGADLGTWALLAGERGAADSVLAALLHWRNASGAGGELFHRNGDFGRNLPPHPTAAAALIALLRNALIFDDGDTLQLTLGARERWWRGSRVRRAPTRWGMLDLDLRQHGGSAAWSWTSVPVWTALTLPPDTRLAAAPGPPLRALSDHVVLAPPGTRSARVAVVAVP
jgi:hypothetical protein